MGSWDDKNEFQYNVEAKSGTRTSLTQSQLYIFESLMSADGVYIVYNTTIGGDYYGMFSSVANWTPPVQTVPTWNFFNLTALNVGLTERSGKTIGQLWNTSNNIYQVSFVTDGTMAGSHAIGYASYGYIPAGLADGGGGNLDSNGVPQDYDYQELGAFSGCLCSESPGHYLEGVGLWVCDSYIRGSAAEEEAASQPTLMTGSIIGVHKSNPSNTYNSYGYVANSIGSQQGQYAPTAAYLAANGWIYGIDFALASFYSAAIRLNVNVSISETTTPAALYFNVGGVSTLAVSSTGVAVTGALIASGFQMTTTPVAGYVLTSDAYGIGSWQPASGVFQLLSDTTPQLGGVLDLNGFYITNGVAVSGDYWFQMSASPIAGHFNIFEVDGGSAGAGIISARYRQAAGKDVTIQHNGTDGWFTSNAGRLWLNAGSYVSVYSPLDLYGQYIYNSVAGGDGNFYLEFAGGNTTDTYNVVMAGGNISGTYGIGVLQARYRKSTTKIIQVYHSGAGGIVGTMYGNLALSPAGGTVVVNGELQLGGDLLCQTHDIVGIEYGTYNNVCCVGSSATQVGCVTAWYGTARVYGVGMYHDGTTAVITSSGGGNLNIEPYSGILELNGEVVSYGADNSGGAGYKVLRIPN